MPKPSPTKEESGILFDFTDTDRCIAILRKCFEPSTQQERVIALMRAAAEHRAEGGKLDLAGNRTEANKLYADAERKLATAKQLVANMIAAEHPNWADRNLWSAWVNSAVSAGATKAGWAGLVASVGHSMRGAVHSFAENEDKDSRISWLESRIKDLEAELSDARSGPSAPLGPPSPLRVPVDRLVPIYIHTVVRQKAAGSFALRVVNKHREAQAQARAWSMELRGLDAERTRRLAEPKAANGPGTPSWDELIGKVGHARAGLVNAVSSLWGPTAAKAAEAESEAQALPLTLSAWSRWPKPLGPPEPNPAPADVSTSGASAVLPDAVPEPAAEADLAALCAAFEEGLLSALRGGS